MTSVNSFVTTVKKKVLLIVTSVPVVHLGDWLTDDGDKSGSTQCSKLSGKDIDFPDHWSTSKEHTSPQLVSQTAA